MSIHPIKALSIIMILAIPSLQQAAENNGTQKNNVNRMYYKPQTVFSGPNKEAKSIGVYKRAQIGNDGAYGTFTQKGKTLSQTVLEHNPTTASISGVTNNKAVGYIQNTNPGAGMSTGAPAYLSLYPYIEPIPQQKKAASHKHSMAMKTANYTQKK